MKYVVPMTAVVNADSQEKAFAAKQQLERFMNQPMVAMAAQSRGIPYEGVSVLDPNVYEQGRSCTVALYAFIEVQSDAQARQVKNLMETFLKEPMVGQMLRAGGVPFVAASVGDAAPWQPPR